MASDLTWIDCDPAELSPETGDRYAAYKAAYRAMKAAKEAFEHSARQEIPAPQGMIVRFGYNFGKLSFALDVANDKRKANKSSLADYLAQMQASGQAH